MFWTKYLIKIFSFKRYIVVYIVNQLDTLKVKFLLVPYSAFILFQSFQHFWNITYFYRGFISPSHKIRNKFKPKLGMIPGKILLSFLLTPMYTSPKSIGMMKWNLFSRPNLYRMNVLRIISQLWPTLSVKNILLLSM